ncbi:DoxX family protein [Mucilaginibacter sp. JRF]|uniref:DoxX family protein n=1 Tax=Mucilaginibacter sp. JRF TaxID=2780088 RepID=UPI00187F1002|nr:DoxX family protein [Mucilaginibacter sp. JRF]MBE9586367.1 DoxX family protein [Mucilaginibacter sp. JRF]
MKPLVVLLISFVFAAALIIFTDYPEGYALAARIAMAIMLIFTAMGHFVYTKGMALMIPPFIPFKKGLVYITGVIELLGAIGLLLPTLARVTGIALIIFFVLILPANIYAALNKVNYQKGTNDGSGATYLWFRVPLQLLFILWVYYSAVA